MKNFRLFWILFLPLVCAFAGPQPQALRPTAPLADLIIVDLEPGIVHLERFVLPYTCKIRNLKNIADLEKVAMRVCWSKDGTTPTNFAQSYFLRDVASFKNKLVTGESLSFRFEIAIPNQSLAEAKKTPYLKAVVNSNASNGMQESNYTNNTRRALVNLNIRDHRSN
ncbi:MAG: hypothetical protein IT260_03360 [Saprospiraceae bacterium]|nr:hypothetical protein [Saprospiraceae bacterium]